MSDKPSAAWYLAPILMGIIGSAIMWYVLKDEDHPDSPKMVKKGWVIGIVLTVIPLIVWVPMMLVMPWGSMDFDRQLMQDHMQVIPESFTEIVPRVESVPEPEPVVITDNVRSLEGTSSYAEPLVCDESYPTLCIEAPPPDLDCNEIEYSHFEVIGDDPHGFDADKDGIGCES